ncbi:acyltransferase family protein [Endozoicomonas sp. 8E]|uniref:acyltransferase family protein n=1 Tax=Endozoicomonas sp. 8E TaxID=3035692 RepID=UPI002938FABA|nr:acyltransferase family protein [Endozoicomonas sp. 8E]WOG27212.1 acyltransferase family protein [Endozoicomonas sp. 8E]
MQRNITLDSLKVVLAFMVVGLHGSFFSDINSQVSYNLVNGLFRIAVPIFFIINGFFFYNAIEKNSLKTWFVRILSLYCFWMLFYSYFWLRPDSYDLHNLAKIIKILIFGYHHLWYLPSTIGAAILLYFLSSKSTRLILLTSFGLYTIGLFIQYSGAHSLFDNNVVNYVFGQLISYRNFLFFGFPFFAFGYLIKKHNVQDKIKISSVKILSLVGILLLLIESSINFFLLDGKEGFDLLFSLLILCPSIFIFTLMFEIKSTYKDMALISTAIYFIHPFLLSLGYKFLILNDTVLTLSVILISIPISFILIYCNNKFRYLL